MTDKLHLLRPEKLLMTRLFAVIAHDIKSPIESNLQLLGLFKTHGATMDEYVQFFSSLEPQMRSSKNILEDLLGWAKLQLTEERGLSENYTAVPLRELTDQIIQSTEYFNLKKHICFLNNIQENRLYNIHVNLYKFVLRNLLMNSIKFSHKNGKTFISADADGESLLVSVTDEGTAVQDEKLTAILNFSGKSECGTQNEPGSGIGLMLCYDCLKYFGGKLGAKSVNKIDTAFFFNIPVRQVS